MRIPDRLQTKPFARLIHGDVRAVAPTLAPQSVHCIFTSPPFYGLRAYPGPALLWGGDPSCDHQWDDLPLHSRRGRQPGQHAVVGATLTRVCPPEVSHGAFCLRCACWKGQLGLEPTSELFIEHLVAIFESLRPVLRDDGTLWVELNDSFHSGEINRHDALTPADDPRQGLTTKKFVGGERLNHRPSGPERDEQLLLVPHRFALAMQAAGWILRMDAVWHISNGKPDSQRGWHWAPHRVLNRLTRQYEACAGCTACLPNQGLVLRRHRGRPVRTHSYVFLFSKAQSRPVARVRFSDLPAERLHLGQDFWPHYSDPWSSIRLCLFLVRTFLNCTQRQQDFCLPPLDTQVRQEGTSSTRSGSVSDLPAIERSAWLSLEGLSLRVLNAQATTKDFFCELSRLWLDLVKSDNFLIRRILSSKVPYPPGVSYDGDASITVNDAGKICQFDFAHGLIIEKKWVAGKYFYDEAAVREPGATTEDRALRSVWTIPSQPLALAHTAAFPERLAALGVLAGTSSRGVCAKCLAPWVRVYRRNEERTVAREPAYQPGNVPTKVDSTGWEPALIPTNRWKPSCACGAQSTVVPAVVLDPFSGSGRCGVAALKQGRSYLGIDASAEYIQMAVSQLTPLMRVDVRSGEKEHRLAASGTPQAGGSKGATSAADQAANVKSVA